MRNALGEIMRPFVAAIALLWPVTALAGSSTGGGGGGGPLAGTSSGIGEATRVGGGGGGGGGGSTHPPPPPQHHDHDDNRYIRDATGALILASAGTAGVSSTHEPLPPDPRGYHGSTVHFYLGAHSVRDSDGALAAELSFVDGRFRFSGSAIRYYERLPDDSLLHMTQGALTGGLRIDDMGNTHVYVELGVVHNKTGNDPVMDTTITGVIGGIHVEHLLTKGTRLVGDAKLMQFPDEIRATSARLGVRFGHFQASLRVLDFNVGPPLYGPELGLAF